ncbi:MAG: M28 family peptidase, partial [bacterium]
LYQVDIESKYDADKLAALDVDPLVRLQHSYLVLTDNPAQLEATGLSVRLIASDITRSEIAIDNRLDGYHLGQYPLLFEEDNLRLFRVNLADLSKAGQRPELARLGGPASVYFVESRPLNREALDTGVDLDSLIGLVEQDSLESYVYRLQAYYRRLTGTDSCYASADWTLSKFQDFGYDSVYYDQFVQSVYGVPTTIKNTVAVKVGSTFPDREIIVCGHRDGVSSSPAADDNGSGTAATMEIGRILANIDSYCTIKFITFSGEEQGLYGSQHYADQAFANGDNIIYVFNMDMIAHYENSDQAKLYHGSDLTYTTLCRDLASSLLGIDAVYYGSSGGSDHYPFQTNGYQVTFLHEYVFSTVYHSYQDSTSYMNFAYMTDMTKLALATVYAAMLDANAPGLAFVYPSGNPEFILADQTTALDVTVSSRNNGVSVPGSGLLHYSVDGAPYQTSALTQLFGNNYTTQLPALSCGQTLAYYVSMEEQSTGVYYDPDPAAPRQPFVVTSVDTGVSDDFELDQGWTTEIIGATSGQWQRGVPVDDDGWDYDPASDADGSGQCYLTQNTVGNTDVDNGAVRLISPIFAMNSGSSISYEYFLYLTDSDGTDMLLVEINSSGGVGTWTEIARHDLHGGLEWHHVEIDAATISGLGVFITANMQLRFTANDGDAQSIVEAGLDAVRVLSYVCDNGEIICGDANADDVVNVTDAVHIVNYIFNSGPAPEPLTAGDVDCSGTANIVDAVYLIGFIFGGGAEPCAACP